MKIDELPRGCSKEALSFPHFPTRHQAVVWRNWGLVCVGKLASVLHTTTEQIKQLAAAMGLQKEDELTALWHERGYLTIIRRNWHLLPYEQMLALLDWTPKQLAYVLKEDDFFWCKLGLMKPDALPIYYAPLAESQQQQTARFKAIVEQHFPSRAKPSEKPFAFLDHYGQTNNPKTFFVESDHSQGLCLIYSYSAVYGDPLLNEKLDPYPDGLLADYAAAGINAIWLQGTLYTLVPWLGESQESNGWQIRLANLKKMCLRAAKYGIKVYLYMNEPRAMPEAFFELHPKWKGMPTKDGLSFSVCTSQQPVLEALSNGVAELFKNVPELGGLFTITMSENLTHCCSRPYDLTTPCPTCTARGPAVVVADLNRAIAEGARRTQPNADIIAWTWAWSPEWDEQAVELLPKDVKLMCVSETAVPTDAMGIKGTVLDYSISKIGPGPDAARLWKKAASCGIRTIAKVQLNNTWECSAVPYIPVAGLVEQHLKNIETFGVKDFMVTWTLGGFPGGNLELLKMSKEKLAAEKYGQKATPYILKAWDFFGRSFEEFPLHSTPQLYAAPQNYGPMNLLFAQPTGYAATMIGFPYDDLESWRGGHYPEDIFEQQFCKLSEGWADGLNLLKQAACIIDAEKQSALLELTNVAQATYCHLRSTYLQIRFIRLREAGSQAELATVLNEEIELAKQLHAVICHDSRIGFEASNHYFYTANDLIEKVLNCEQLKAASCLTAGDSKLHPPPIHNNHK